MENLDYTSERTTPLTLKQNQWISRQTFLIAETCHKLGKLAPIVRAFCCGRRKKPPRRNAPIGPSFKKVTKPRVAYFMDSIRNLELCLMYDKTESIGQPPIDLKSPIF